MIYQGGSYRVLIAVAIGAATVADLGLGLYPRSFPSHLPLGVKTVVAVVAAAVGAVAKTARSLGRLKLASA